MAKWYIISRFYRSSGRLASTEVRQLSAEEHKRLLARCREQTMAVTLVVGDPHDTEEEARSREKWLWDTE